MKIDLGSWAVRLSINADGATPVWGTALGQGKGYLYSFSDQDKYFWAMDKCAVDINKVSCPMGKGGNQFNNYKIIRAALFENVIIHNDNRIIPLNNAKFVLVELEQLVGIHTGRKSIKYNPNNCYDKSQKKRITNEKCFKLIEQQLSISQEDGWFVSNIEFEKGNELHISVHVLRGTTIFSDVGARKAAMVAKLKGVVSHYTSLDAVISIINGIENGQLKFRATRSDCLNDPNECRYGAEMCERIFKQGVKNQLGKPFLLSFCKTSDSPVMWRLYESKIQLVFNRYDIELAMDSTSTKKVKLEYGDVLYYDLRHIANQHQFKEETGMSLSTSNRNYIISLIKHIDYKIEDEWRIIAAETGRYVQPDRFDDLAKGIVGVDSAFGLLKMYREIQIPVSALKEIIVYEFDDAKFDLMKSQIEDLLNRKNITGINIKKTECAGVRSK